MYMCACMGVFRQESEKHRIWDSGYLPLSKAGVCMKEHIGGT